MKIGALCQILAILAAQADALPTVASALPKCQKWLKFDSAVRFRKSLDI